MGLISRQAGVDLDTRIQAWVNQLRDELELIVKNEPVTISTDKSILVTAFPRLVLLWLLRREDIPDYILVDFSLSHGALDLTLTDPTHNVDWVVSRIDKISTHIKGLKKITVRTDNYQNEHLFTLEGDSKWAFRKL